MANDEACELIRELLDLAGIGDRGMTNEVMQRLIRTAERARAYLDNHCSEGD